MRVFCACGALNTTKLNDAFAACGQELVSFSAGLCSRSDRFGLHPPEPLWPGKAAVLSKRMLRDSREPAYRVPSSCASPPLLHCAAWPGKAAVLSSACCATAASLPAACLRTADEAAGIPRSEQRNERRKRDAV